MTEDAYARKEGFPTKIVMAVLAGIVIILWFIFGYGYFTSPLPPQGSEPPTIWLVYQGDIYTGIRGSYCWADKCIDAIFPDPTGTIEVAKGVSISFMMNSLVRPSSMSVQVFVVDEKGIPSQVGELVSEGIDKYKVNLENGIYIVNVLASWNDLGNVSYAFRINVS
jgi:hypothetical protein